MGRVVEVAVPLVGRDEVVGHPHRDLMDSPWPDGVPCDVCVDGPAAGEGIEQQRSGAEVADDEVAVSRPRRAGSRLRDALIGRLRMTVDWAARFHEDWGRTRRSRSL